MVARPGNSPDRHGAWLAGVDGCRGGWIAVLLNGDRAELRVEPAFAALFAGQNSPAVVAIDIPIGLPDRTGPGGRTAETLVRPRLGARQSSVFSVPARAAIEAADYGAACAAALASSDPPRKVSRQLFNLAPKIREVDAVLRARPALVPRVFEVHPELAFATMNGGPLAEPKKVKSRPHPPGLAERRALLHRAGLPEALIDAPPPSGAGPDDLLDALACAWIARRLFTGRARPNPDPPERDRFGLPMAIWA